MKKTILLSFALAVFFFACKDDDEEIFIDVPQVFEVLEISTEFGEMYVHLYDSTPLHKANFDSLTRAGFYDSTEFHRIIPNFMSQGGDPNSKDDDRSNDGTGGPGYTVKAEIDSANFKHTYGALASARTGNNVNPEKRSSGSQFYIVNSENGAHHLDGEYTTFGMVIQGKEVAKTIANQPRNANNQPNDRIKMAIKYQYFTKEQLAEKGIVLP